MVALASSRGGSNRGSTPTKFHGPSPSARATPNERKPRAANPSTAASTPVFTCDALADSSRITWGAPFVTLNEDPSVGGDGGLGALAHRIEGLELDHVVVVQRLIVRQAPENGQIDGVGVVGA